jgi:hypothetical protein
VLAFATAGQNVSFQLRSFEAFYMFAARIACLTMQVPSTPQGKISAACSHHGAKIVQSANGQWQQLNLTANPKEDRKNKAPV